MREAGEFYVGLVYLSNYFCVLKGNDEVKYLNISSKYYNTDATL